eukprot:Platyproteum_vivax@DN12467_c0_g1_i1.p2
MALALRLVVSLLPMFATLKVAKDYKDVKDNATLHFEAILRSAVQNYAGQVSKLHHLIIMMVGNFVHTLSKWSFLPSETEGFPAASRACESFFKALLTKAAEGIENDVAMA